MRIKFDKKCELNMSYVRGRTQWRLQNYQKIKDYILQKFEIQFLL